MKLKKVQLRNFRRLENVEIGFEDEETVFVGPNNSGKTSATAAFRLFLNSSEFKVHDFSVSKTKVIDAFGVSDGVDEDSIPSIEMDLWFSLDPDVEFGRSFPLVSSVTDIFDEVGVRLKLCVKDASKLKAEYLSVFPQNDGSKPKKTLSQYLSLMENINRHFSLRYFALEKADDGPVLHPLDPEEGKRVLRNLIRVDFVDAQRNIDDQEVGRSNRLSSAFAAFYKKNLEQAEDNEEANRVIDENNDKLTKHYDEHFKDLMMVIRGLGVPSVNDRQMRIVSTLRPEVALQGNTDLLYVDPSLEHELPEAYNGLGFKNLVFMAIQISHFHLQWMRTKDKRPLCQLIFVEEPEVHLHAQVQQTFITNIWGIIRKASADAGLANMVPQLGITTHSSHILDAVEFSKVRYFRRCALDGENPAKVTMLNASKVLSLRDFKPNKKSAAGEAEKEAETLDFLKRYLRLTHCDLFFADAAVLVEGAVEKLLLYQMIDKVAPGLKQNFLTVLEVGGAYAHRFASLMEFLGIPYLVITDLDSVDPSDKRKICRADSVGAVSSNASLKFYFNKSKISELVSINKEDKILADVSCCVSFETPTPVADHDPTKPMCGRTFEETFIYQNIELFRDKKLSFGTDMPVDKVFENEYATVFDEVSSKSFKKTEFALDIASSDAAWIPPNYITEGLCWLEGKMGSKLKAKTVSEAVL